MQRDEDRVLSGARDVDFDDWMQSGEFLRALRRADGGGADEGVAGEKYDAQAGIERAGECSRGTGGGEVKVRIAERGGEGAEIAGTSGNVGGGDFLKRYDIGIDAREDVADLVMIRSSGIAEAVVPGSRPR